MSVADTGACGQTPCPTAFLPPPSTNTLPTARPRTSPRARTSRRSAAFVSRPHILRVQGFCFTTRTRQQDSGPTPYPFYMEGVSQLGFALLFPKGVGSPTPQNAGVRRARPSRLLGGPCPGGRGGAHGRAAASQRTPRCRAGGGGAGLRRCAGRPSAPPRVLVRSLCVCWAVGRVSGFGGGWLPFCFSEPPTGGFSVRLHTISVCFSLSQAVRAALPRSSIM